MNLLLTLTLTAPLLLILSGLYRKRWSAPIAAVPALLTAALIPADHVIALDWFLLGAQLGTDELSAWMLPASALLWAGAGLHHAWRSGSPAQAAPFRLFFLLAMTGNLLLVLAQDVMTFYVGYSIMGLSAYGLVHDRPSSSAPPAASTYLRWTIAGELLLFSGLVSLAYQAGSTGFSTLAIGQADTITVLLLLAGLGIKIGLPGLHAWMPWTYAAGQAAGSAVFSGAMVNAGLIGLLRFLPLQQPGHAEVGQLLLAWGLLGAFYGVLFGLLQRTPRAILAYSSVSQMSSMAAMLGFALIEPELAPAIIAAITVYAVHHGLSKGALFLAQDDYRAGARPRLSFAILVLLSLMLAGAPYTSGAIAKTLIKTPLTDEYAWIGSVLLFASTATTLLMLRFLFAVRASRRQQTPAPLASGAGVAIVLLVCAHLAAYTMYPLPTLSLHAIWPVILALLLGFAFMRLPAATRAQNQPEPPMGDLPTLMARWLIRRRWIVWLHSTLAAEHETEPGKHHEG